MVTLDNIAIIIPFHKDIEMLKLSLNTLEKSLSDRCPPIIIVGNNKNSDAITPLHQFSKYEIYIIKENLFWPGAINYGAKCTDKDYLLFCDPDLFYTQNWLNNLINSYNAHKNIGVLSAKLINPLNNRVMDFGMGYNHFNTIHISKGLYYNHPVTIKDRQTQAACGAVFLTSHSLFDTVGGIDETMPFIYCDNDYCIKLADLGYETWVAGQSLVYHKGNTDENNSKYQYFKYLREDSKAAFYAKNHSKVHIDILQCLEYMYNWHLDNNHSFESGYYMYNFCTLFDANEYINSLSLLGINILNQKDIVLAERDIKHINLSNFISTRMLYSNVPFIYLVDSFTSLFDNDFFYKIRDISKDIAVDRQCNIINVSDIKSKNI